MASLASAANSLSAWSRQGSRVLLLLAFAYLLFVVLVMLFQRRLIYIPTRLDPNQAKDLAHREAFEPWHNEHGEIIGWRKPANSTPTGSVLIAHGNAGCALHRGYLAAPIHDAAAVDVYVLEYPGYGARKGSPGQRPILEASDEAIELLAKRGPVYVVGESIGVGVATHLAQNHGETIGGLMLLTPYNNLVSVAQRQMPFLPVAWLLWDRFNPANDLINYKGPVGFVLAGADTVIPHDLGRKLHDGYAGPKTLQIIPEAGHNDVADQSSEWWKSVFNFWAEHGPTK